MNEHYPLLRSFPCFSAQKVLHLSFILGKNHIETGEYLEQATQVEPQDTLEA